MSSLMSIEEVNSLTVPKLKAELTRLGQPLAGLKRKTQFVEALTVSATDEGSKPNNMLDPGGRSFAVGGRLTAETVCALVPSALGRSMSLGAA